jgi:hypothetical protein
MNFIKGSPDPLLSTIARAHFYTGSLEIMGPSTAVWLPIGDTVEETAATTFAGIGQSSPVGTYSEDPDGFDTPLARKGSGTSTSMSPSPTRRFGPAATAR